MIFRAFSPLTLAAALLFSMPALAQGNDASVSALRATLADLSQEQRALEVELATKREQLVALRNRPSAEQAELLEAEAAVRQARSELAANPAPDVQARLNNAEFKLTLAERKWSKSNAEAAALAEVIAALERRLSEQKAAEQRTRQQLAAAERSVQDRLVRERAERERKERELELTRREAEAAQAEIERLKALLAEREAASQTEAGEAAGEEAAAAAEPAATTRSSATIEPSARPADQAPPAADGLARLATQSEVLTELRRLQAAVAQADGRERLVNDVLWAKRFDGDREVDKIRVSLRALGNGQFRGQEQLPAGDYRLVVGFDEWPLTLSGHEAAAAQVFLLDRSSDASRLVLYSEQLEHR